MSLLTDAIKIAEEAHRGQFRKYSGEPYIVHPYRVALKVRSAFYDSELMESAAWLHDVIEDCDIKYLDIINSLDRDVCSLVLDLSNRYTTKRFPDLNRAERKRLENLRIKNISQEAKVIKLCDRIDNILDIPKSEPFLVKYKQESLKLLESLYGADLDLEEWLKELCDE